MNTVTIIAVLFGTLFLSESNSQNSSEKPENEPNKEVSAQEETKVFLLGDHESDFDGNASVRIVFYGTGVKTEKSSIKARIARNALLLLRKGNDKYRAGKLDEALNHWNYVTKRDPNTPAWNMAILNSGRVLQSEKRYHESISVFRVLLDSNDFNRLPKKEIFFGRHMEIAAVPRIKVSSDPMDFYLNSHNNDWHSACSAMSSCYESLGMLEKSHEYAALSRSKYFKRQGGSWIFMKGNWYERFPDIDTRLDKKIATLEAKIKKKPAQK